MSTRHFVTRLDASLHGHMDLDDLQDTRCQIVTLRQLFPLDLEGAALGRGATATADDAGAAEAGADIAADGASAAHGDNAKSRGRRNAERRGLADAGCLRRGFAVFEPSFSSKARRRRSSALADGQRL
jgi:hypothetical protein